MTDDEIAASVRQFGEGSLVATADDLQKWIDSKDLRTLSIVYEIVAPKWGVIENASRRQYGDLIEALLSATLKNPHGVDDSLAFIDVSRIYVFWLRQLAKESKDPEARAILKRAVDDLGRRYIEAPESRARIVNGIVEHAFETEAVRSFFSHWASDATLIPAYQAAKEWMEGR
jgi:hypothetical protein